MARIARRRPRLSFLLPPPPLSPLAAYNICRYGFLRSSHQSNTLKISHDTKVAQISGCRKGAWLTTIKTSFLCHVCLLFPFIDYHAIFSLSIAFSKKLCYNSEKENEEGMIIIMKQVQTTKIGSLKEKDPAKKGKIDVLDVPVPQLTGDSDVKIKVAYCSICGSDPHSIEGIFGQPAPFGMGHEISGVVEELGPKATVNGLKVGDRIAGNFLRYCGTCYYCRNGQQQYCAQTRGHFSPGMSEYAIWHENQVYKIPDNVSLRTACLLEPVSIAVRVTDRANFKVGARVAIQGGGPIGLLLLQMMKKRAATSLTLIEPIAERRDLAKRFGADHVIDPNAEDVVKKCLAITNGLGYDCVVEASGFIPAAKIPIDIAANEATLMYISMFDNDYEMPINNFDVFHQRELTFTCTRVAPYSFPRAVQMMEHMDLEPFTRKVFYLGDAVEAFDCHMSGQFPKILINCNKDLADK
jgi:(R,R)-butanediol dehydrogenase/meso-butanediol dehydrogenase/diacetyl reductase/L-iditol 2-dehydrogenase